MTDNKLTLSQGELNVLKTCQWKHHLRYEQNLEPVKDERIRAFRLGSMIHAGLAGAYEHRQRMENASRSVEMDDVVSASSRFMRELDEQERLRRPSFLDSDAEWEAEQAEIIDDAENLVRMFLGELFMTDSRYRVLAVEMPFRVPIVTRSGRRSGDTLEGVMDLVLWDRFAKKVVLGEHKSTIEDASGFDFRIDVDPQMPLYGYALRHIFGEDNFGGDVVLNVIRKSVPKEPSINKDGTVSTAACSTTRSIYRQALMDQDMPDWLFKATSDVAAADTPKKLDKAKEKLAKARERWAGVQKKQEDRLLTLPNVSRFVARHESHIPNRVIDRHSLDAWTGARLIRLFRRGELYPMKNGASCNSKRNGTCFYRDGCVDEVVAPDDLIFAERSKARHQEVIDAVEDFNLPLLQESWAQVSGGAQLGDVLGDLVKLSKVIDG